MGQYFPFASLTTADLVVDATYAGGTKGNTGDDPIGRLIPGAGNQGGFRQVGSRNSPALVVLYSSMDDRDWPDYIDVYTGAFTYFGDNKRPGHHLRKTPRGGNELLERSFDIIHSHASAADRLKVPPFLVFTRSEKGRDVLFRGLAVPGARGNPPDDLVAMWRSTRGERFQNYRATFTILDAARIARAWINALTLGNPMQDSAPKAWLRWINTGFYEPLTSEPTIQYRTPAQQTPSPGGDMSLLRSLLHYFKDDPHQFEHFAARLAVMMDSNISIEKVTRPSVDGGRDAIGTYRIGPTADKVPLDFALEAKCYALSAPVGVKALARLISRLRHRQFGILVTTSYLGRQAYEELRGDGHPVIVISGADIVAILVKEGLGTPHALNHWLVEQFPPPSTPKLKPSEGADPTDTRVTD